MKPFCLFIFAVSTLRFTGAFLPLTASPLLRSAGISSNSQTAVSVSRRDVGETVALSTFLTVVSTFSFLEQASASGGATAGGVYLLSAKQRYNARVSKGVSSFVALKGPLESGEIEPVRSFFTSEEEGYWKDFSAAGYLLANAFRRNSSAAPDTLPAVKKWKAFAARVEAMTVSLKKKDVKGAQVAHGAALTALDEYLELVELASAK